MPIDAERTTNERRKRGRNHCSVPLTSPLWAPIVFTLLSQIDWLKMKWLLEVWFQWEDFANPKSSFARSQKNPKDEFICYSKCSVRFSWQLLDCTRPSKWQWFMCASHPREVYMPCLLILNGRFSGIGTHGSYSRSSIGLQETFIPCSCYFLTYLITGTNMPPTHLQ